MIPSIIGVAGSWNPTCHGLAASKKEWKGVKKVKNTVLFNKISLCMQMFKSSR
jgi:hypothetical protein